MASEQTQTSFLPPVLVETKVFRFFFIVLALTSTKSKKTLCQLSKSPCETLCYPNLGSASDFKKSQHVLAFGRTCLHEEGSNLGFKHMRAVGR